MKLDVNGQAHNVPRNTSVAELLTLLAAGGGRIAVEVNGEIVPRSKFDQHRLQEHDRVEIVQAIGGG
jgi:sulfur carrier protein